MSSIEDRVSKLEEEVFGKKGREKNWRSTVGMFGNDPFMNEVIEGALDHVSKNGGRPGNPLNVNPNDSFGYRPRFCTAASICGL